jgi:hypothetical protein
MKTIQRYALALATLGTCAIAAAQPYSQADQERRDRNREEVMAQHQHDMDRDTHKSGAREEMHEGAQKVRSKTHKAAQSTRSFTHHQLNKVRNFGERQQAKFPDKPRIESTSKTPNAIGTNKE